MIEKIRNIYSSQNILKLKIFFISTLSVIIQIIALEFSGSIGLILAYNAVFIFIIYYLISDNDFIVILLLLNIIPLVVLEKVFTRFFFYVLIQNIPLVILTILAIFQLVYVKVNKKSVLRSYLGLPITIFTLFSLFSAINGYFNGGLFSNIIHELHQNLYYSLTIPIIYLMKEREKFQQIFIAIIVVVMIICIEYILINSTINYRFTTIQNLILPLPLAYFYSLLLLKKRMSTRLFCILGILVVWTASFAVQLRALWIANLLTMFIVSYVYIRNHKMNNLRKMKNYFLLLPLLALPILFFSLKDKVNYLSETNVDRLESISDPLEDLSFLMRVEINYLGIKRFIENPIIGEGYGNTLKFQILENTQVTYPDNSFLYFLWKGGLVGLSILLWLFFRFFKLTMIVFNKTSLIKTKIIMLCYVGAFTGFMLLALLQANLIAFKISIIYPIIFAHVQFEYNHLKLNTDDRMSS